MARIILVRHGQTEFNRIERFRGLLDIPLNETGLKQAEATGESLRGMNVKAVYSGPLSRARNTAGKIAEKVGLDIEVVDFLQDMDFGEWEGLTPREVAEKFPEPFKAWSYYPDRLHMPGGESLLGVRARLVAGLNELTMQHKDDTIVLVSHKVICRVLMLAVMGMDVSHFWRIEQDNCCINVFEENFSGWIVTRLNDTCHLEGL